MTNVVYFFDSYAMIEIIKGNKNYEKYINCIVITSKLNLFEVFYALLREFNEKEANSFLDQYYSFVIDYDMPTISEAAKLKHLYKKRKLSMADCIGYVLAKKMGVKFLTGDKEFEDIENVEFIK